MLDRKSLIETFEEVLGRRPASESWLNEALARHVSRESLITELTSSEEFQKKTIATSGTFGRVFTSPTPSQPGSRGRPELLQSIRAQLKEVQRLQADYHPVYGLGADDEKSPRLDNLRFDCECIDAEFQGFGEKGQIRILDVGCNLGYATFKLAQLGYNTAGLDIDGRNIRVCMNVAAYTASTARFETMDFFRVAEKDDLDWENVDCILLLNVIHQLIFQRGLPYAKTLLSRLAKRVDMFFIELATKQDYVSHGKDHLLPDDPVDVLSECQDCEIKLLKNDKRPLYRIRRSLVSFGPLSIRADHHLHSDNKTAAINRKYYLGDGRFLKLFRFTQRQNRDHYDRELRGLLALQGSGFAPKILDWNVSENSAALLMERITGIALRSCYDRFTDPARLHRFLGQYLAISAELARQGLYHNDLAPHNIFVREDNSICAIDFDQADTTSRIDPFAVMLWTIYDILAGSGESYRRQVYLRIYDAQGIGRANREHYPDFSAVPATKSLREFIARAETSESWSTFLKEMRLTTDALTEIA